MTDIINVENIIDLLNSTNKNQPIEGTIAELCKLLKGGCPVIVTKESIMALDSFEFFVVLHDAYSGTIINKDKGFICNGDDSTPAFVIYTIKSNKNVSIDVLETIDSLVDDYNKSISYDSDADFIQDIAIRCNDNNFDVILDLINTNLARISIHEKELKEQYELSKSILSNLKTQLKTAQTLLA